MEKMISTPVELKIKGNVLKAYLEDVADRISDDPGFDASSYLYQEHEDLYSAAIKARKEGKYLTASISLELASELLEEVRNQVQIASDRVDIAPNKEYRIAARGYYTSLKFLESKLAKAIEVCEATYELNTELFDIEVVKRYAKAVKEMQGKEGDDLLEAFEVCHNLLEGYPELASLPTGYIKSLY